jgi:hypothetical protein
MAKMKKQFITNARDIKKFTKKKKLVTNTGKNNGKVGNHPGSRMQGCLYRDIFSGQYGMVSECPPGTNETMINMMHQGGNGETPGGYDWKCVCSSKLAPNKDRI